MMEQAEFRRQMDAQKLREMPTWPELVYIPKNNRRRTFLGRLRRRVFPVYGRTDCMITLAVFCSFVAGVIIGASFF